MLLTPFVLQATPEYAQQTGSDCQTCHIEATSGGKLTKVGEDFRDDLRTKGLYRPLAPIQKVVRLMIGYLHLLTAITWFGTILYVHILLKPAYAAKGLPKGELILGWLSIHSYVRHRHFVDPLPNPNLENVLYYKVWYPIEREDISVSHHGDHSRHRHAHHRS